MSAHSRRLQHSAATKGPRRVDRHSRIEPYTWLGAGAVTLGIGAALVGGAGVAHAEDGAGGGSPSSSNSTSESNRNARHSDVARDDDTDSTAQQPRSKLPSSRGVQDSAPQQDADPNDSSNSVVSSGESGASPSEPSADGVVTKSDDDDVPVTPDDPPTAGDSTDRSESESGDTRADSTPSSAATQADDHSPAPTASSLTTAADATPRIKLQKNPAASNMGTEVVKTAATQALSSSTSRREATSGSVGISAPPQVVGNPTPPLQPNRPVNRLALAIDSLLKPFGTLLTELGGLILGTRADPVPPGACEDGDCNPTSEIYLPFVRNEITVLNLTGRRVTLSNLDTKLPLTYGPQAGFVLENARQVELAFYQGNSYHDDEWTYAGTMQWSDESTTVSVDVEASGAIASTTNSRVQTVIFETPEAIGGPSQIALRQTLVLLPEAGTLVTIDSTDPVGQALVASALCKVSGSCTQAVVDEEVMLSAPKQVGNTLFNDGSVVSTNRYKVVHEVTKTSGVEESLKVVASTGLNFALGPLSFETEIGALVQQKYGHSWSDGVTTESQVDLDVPPGSYGQIYVQYPEYRDYVTMTLTNSGVTVTIPDVEYVSLAPSGVIDQNGNPIAVTYTTVDWEIGTGPHPFPNSNSEPTPPATTAAGFVTPPDIAPPVPAPTSAPKSLFDIVGRYLRDQAQAFRMLPNIVFAGRAISSQTIQVVNLSPYAQTLGSISGEYEADDSPAKGFVLQPFQRIDIEVDYNAFQDQEAYVSWTNSTGIAITAELKVFNGGSAPLVTCQSSGCMADDADRDTGIMYLIYPQSTPGRMDVTNDPNLAAAAVDVACAPGYGGSMPGSCGINVTGDIYYNVPTSGPVQQQINRGSQTNSYYYTVTTTKSESSSWSAGGGIKLKEKAGVFINLQLEIEASVLYNSSVQVKDSESSTVVQNLLPDYGGSIYLGDPYLRTYGDYVVNLPNLTMIVTGQWIEAASGLAAQGPVANVVDYPLS